MPGGVRGVRLKLKLPKVAAYNEILGWQREDCRRFNVMSHCGNNMYHSWIGKFGLSVAIPARKCFSIFGLRALRRFGDASADGQVGRLLGIFECFAEFFTAFIFEDVKFRDSFRRG